MKGFRVPPAPTKNEKMRSMETEMENLQMAGRVSQMMIQQLLQNVKTMGDDLSMALNQLYELQYKYSALQQYLNVDSLSLAKIANELRLQDFNEAAAKADLKDGLTSSDVATKDSTITITSIAADSEGKERGIFRSRIKLSESGVPELISALEGKRVGDVVKVQLNGLEHQVELLSIKDGQPTQEAVQ